MEDYVIYIDTDSLYFDTFQGLIDQGVNIDKGDSLTQDEQIKYVNRIGKEVENYINKKSYGITQKEHYNSPVDDFQIEFEQEKITLSALFLTKKRYATWTLTDGGKGKDEMSITGMEIIRSDSPEVVKPMIKQVVEMILKFYPDNEIKSYIKKCKRELKICTPEQISENKTINNVKKYIHNDIALKGTPHQIKGGLNMKLLLKRFDLDKKYDIPQEGNKAKIVYLQKNPYRMESLSFLTGPEEFDSMGIEVDMKKMIENNFTKKLKRVLEVIDKSGLLENRVNLENLFGG